MTTDSAVHRISGRVGIRERIAIPPGAVLTVKLVSPDGEVLAATAFEDSMEFELATDSIFAPDPEQLRLWAMLRTESGIWGTPELVSVRTDVMLQRVDG